METTQLHPEYPTFANFSVMRSIGLYRSGRKAYEKKGAGDERIRDSENYIESIEQCFE